MLTRRTLAAATAGLALAPGFAQAQAAMRRTLDAGIAFPEAGRRAWADQVPQIRIGILGGENEADRLGRYGPFRQLVEDTFKVPARLFMAADFNGVVQAFGAKQLEMASIGPAVYAAAWLDTNGGVEPLTVAEEADGSASYIGVMITRADSGITSIEQMKGRSLAWPDPHSASGYLIPRFALRQAGYDPEPGKYFSRTGFAGGHEQGVIAVLQKQYDAAFTWASGQGDAAQGYSRGNLRAMIDKGVLKMEDLRIIWRTEPVIYGPLTVRAELPAAFKEDMKLFHLGLPKAHPEIYRQIERGNGTGYREVSHEQFKLLIDMRREEAAERRRR